MKLPFLRRGRALVATVMSAVLVVIGLVALPFLAAPAYAVTGTTGPISVTVTPTSGLTSGQTIGIDATANSGTISDILVHVCDPGILPVNQFKFTSDVYCPNSTLTGGDSSNVVDQTLANTTTGHADFKAGVGHAHWIDGFNASPPANTHDLDCNFTHSCLLVMQFSSNVAPGTFYFSTPLTYAAATAPSAPTLSSATAGDTTIAASWTAPTNLGNGTINQYTVTATRTGGAADAGSPHVVTPAGTATTTTLTGLNNFTTYAVKVSAQNTDGTNTNSSPDSNVLSATPGPAGPTNVVGTPANNTVNLTWTPPANVVGLTSYVVTTYLEPAHTVVGTPLDTGSTTAAAAITAGITNGSHYKFTVAANYGGTIGTASALSAEVVPTDNSAFVRQAIDVNRPVGALVLTQACASSDIYPVDANGVPNPVYPTDCTVDLGKATLLKTGINAGSYFEAHHPMNPVSVVDTREEDTGWTASVAVSDFVKVGSPTVKFSGNDLGFVPNAANSPAITTPDGIYTQEVDAGPAVGAAAPGLSAAKVLAHAPARTGLVTDPLGAKGGLGLATLGAGLNLFIPVFAASGNYAATMTITVVNG